jgi:RNA polymerase sigma-70 factor (ECF subfamily)
MADHDSRSDAELLAATREDVEAFGVFYRRHVASVLGLLSRRLGDAELAADVTSEVFAAALGASERYDPARGAGDSWLYGIVANQLGSAIRRGSAERRARRRLGMDPVRVDGEDIDWIESLAALEDGRLAMRLLSELPDDQRELVAGRVLEERGYEELAGAHAISQATVRKRVSRGLARLRARLMAGGIAG